MKAVPILYCRNMGEAIAFYTQVLDFTLKYPGTGADNPVVAIVNGHAELQLSILRGDQPTAIAVNLWVEKIDALREKYLGRGLNPKHYPDSPVHNGPIDQTWGTREWYLNDPTGNTLRFVMPGS